MKTTTSAKLKQLYHSLPEIWYILLLTLWLIPAMQIANGIITILSIGALTLLIKQLFHKSAWMSVILGSLLSAGALLMLLALFSEYSEFPVKNDPKAIQLLLGGILIIGTSLTLAVRMLFKGALKS